MRVERQSELNYSGMCRFMFMIMIIARVSRVTRMKDWSIQSAPYRVRDVWEIGNSSAPDTEVPIATLFYPIFRCETSRMAAKPPAPYRELAPIGVYS